MDGSEDAGKTQSVWVLDIRHDDMSFREAHRTFEGAVAGAIKDMKGHEVLGRVRDYEDVRKCLNDDKYFLDVATDTVYDIDECSLVD